MKRRSEISLDIYGRTIVSDCKLLEKINGAAMDFLAVADASNDNICPVFNDHCPNRTCLPYIPDDSDY